MRSKLIIIAQFSLNIFETILLSLEGKFMSLNIDYV